ncbi:Hypothetical predicted protein [Paramuricea clavata]|uniref:Uncharacterized protein n=1 Tax=Paramuricea clavata TaxID=317549 RepID=A0A6S7K096_PARCT|nr:Hypothetical predicted protein [Paramuricea clavata]
MRVSTEKLHICTEKRLSVTEQWQYSTDKFDFHRITTHLYGEGATLYGEVISEVKQYSKSPVVYRGEDAADKFLECLEEEQKHIQEKLDFVESMRIGREEEQAFQDAVNCHICGYELGADRVRDHCHLTGNDKVQLLLRKGVYPYDHMDCIERFEEPTLPPKGSFYNVLNDEQISDGDYAHATSVFKSFVCQNMGDYHDLYLMSDVLLLADVFENFRSVCLKAYNLDPCQFYTSPGLAACLKMTDVELELAFD